MKYESLSELRSVVEAFEAGYIRREEWGHAEHLIVAYIFVMENGPDKAFVRMRSGILNLLRSFGVDTSIEMPYHETLTAFWIGAVAHFFANRTPGDHLEDISTLVRDFGKDYPLRFYSRELLYSDRARSAFIPPDIEPISWPPPASAKRE